MFVLSHLVEWLEDLLQFIGSNADTIVLDGNGEISYLRILIFIQFGRQEESKFGIGLDVQFYVYGSPDRHSLEGIGEEVEIDFLQQIPVEPYRLAGDGMFELQMNVPI